VGVGGGDLEHGSSRAAPDELQTATMVPICCVRLPDVLDDSTSRTQAELVSFPL
jgi:hypothetical protein